MTHSARRVAGLRDMLSSTRVSPSAVAFAGAWRDMRDELRIASSGIQPTTGPLATRVEDAGLGIARRLQRQLTRQLEERRVHIVHLGLMDLPPDSHVRQSWLAVDCMSSCFLAQHPTPDLRLEAREFCEEANSYLGLPSPAAVRLVDMGRTRIPNMRAQRQPRVLDRWASEVERASSLGDSWRVQHDAVARVVTRDVLGAGFAGTDQPRRMFMHVVPAATLVSSGISAIIPDLKVRLRFADSQTPSRWRDFERDHLFDFKCAHMDCPAYRSRPARTERSGAVRHYADQVHGGVMRHARQIDARARGASSGGTDGPVARELATYPPVHGLVFGSRSEASPDVHQLARVVASQLTTASWRVIGARSRSEAYSGMLTRLRRRWGCTASREHARMRLARLEFVESRGHIAPPSTPSISEVRAQMVAEFHDGVLDPDFIDGGVSHF